MKVITSSARMRDSYSNDMMSVHVSVYHMQISPKLSTIELWLLLNIRLPDSESAIRFATGRTDWPFWHFLQQAHYCFVPLSMALHESTLAMFNVELFFLAVSKHKKRKLLPGAAVDDIKRLEIYCKVLSTDELKLNNSFACFLLSCRWCMLKI